MTIKKSLPIILISTTLLLGACNKNNATTSSTSTSDSTKVVALSLDKTSDVYGDYQDEDYTVATKGETTITFSGDSADISGSGASLKDNTLQITKGGVYELSGDFSGNISIDSSEEVTLLLNGLTLTNETGPGINIVEAKKVIVTLAEGSENIITDGENYEATETDDPTSAIYSKADLTFNGTGSLQVTGNYNNGIQSKDDLTFISGTYNVKAVNNALKGKDKVAILNGTFNLETTSGDAIQATNTEDTEKGYVAIDGGNLTIDTGSDGIQAETALYLQNATVDVTTENKSSSEDISLKALKAGNNLVVDSGTFTISSKDDAFHSNGDLTINQGEFSISAGDDALHAEYNLTINDGTVDVLKSEEGLEGEAIVLNGGNINVTANDDGINAAAASTSSNTSNNQQHNMVQGDTPSDGEMPNDGTTPPEKPSGDMEQGAPEGMTPPDQQGTVDSGENTPDATTTSKDNSTEDAAASDKTENQNPGQMSGGTGGGGPMDESDGSTLEINGGTITVNAQGDGLDSNGDITMTGGNVTVYGPENSGNGTLDYAGSYTLSGGTLLGVGSSGMAQTVSEDSTQVNLAFYLDELTTGSKVTIEQNGQTLSTFSPSKQFQQIVFSSPELTTGEVTITIDGTSYPVTLSATANSLSQDGSTYTATMTGPGGNKGMGRPSDVTSNDVTSGASEKTEEETTTEISGDSAV